MYPWIGRPNHGGDGPQRRINEASRLNSTPVVSNHTGRPSCDLGTTKSKAHVGLARRIALSENAVHLQLRDIMV